MERARNAIRAGFVQPSLLGSIQSFSNILDRCAALGFTSVALPSPFVDAEDWQQARLADPDRLAEVFQCPGSGIEGLAALAGMARERSLDLVIDLRVDQLSGHAPVVASKPGWFRPRRATEGAPPDPRRPSTRADVAVARFDDASVSDELARWWGDLLRRWHEAGVAGFRCLWPQNVPSASWTQMIEHAGGARFWAWTPGIPTSDLAGLSECGFQGAFSSLAWWDFHSHWYLEEDDRLRSFPAVVAAADAPYSPPSPSRLGRSRKLGFAGATADGLFVVLDEHPDSLTDDAIQQANRAIAERADTPRKGLRPLTAGGGAPVLTLLGDAINQDGQVPKSTLVAVNPDDHHVMTVAVRDWLHHAGGFTCLEPLHPEASEPFDATADGATITLEPGEVRTWRATQPAMVTLPKSRKTAEQAAASGRIAIESVAPVVDSGRFPVKRIVGERVAVQADILCDGHDRLAAAVLWRPVGSRTWNSSPMRHLGNDRWCGEFTLARVGRHEFTIEAWRDEFATARADLEKRQAAGKLSTLDVDEVCQLVERAATGSGDAELAALSKKLGDTGDDSERVALLVAPDTAQAMARSGPRPFLIRHPTPLQVDSERTAAGFSSWYELFPRSQATGTRGGDQPHGTFDDVIARLPAIREMGFDVLYMPPIHPIGRTNRKGRNNSVTAEPGEPGSPYAIGAKEGGHDAIHPELGTLDDFRRLVAAAAGQGMELALDFAIQCSPDHPWLREHPDWFAWRADGTIRYAENPPKRYEDIVNVDFYADGAIPDLWIALRDVVAFWVNEGVRLFRVDNPHTKPFPFWEWLIGEIRGRHPDVVFLSEAFTRPKLMYRLAKVGFSQSYTYFTWRNNKHELTAYLTELADTGVKDYFRPHFFVNTPDINPTFLHHSGRAGHLIRAALATTLSGLWGMYSGFELCEATPLLPGKEEYLDSEKYQLRDWDWQRPGNIIAEVTRLNLLRRLNPALQTHLGVRFYNAFNDNILYFGKRTGERGDMVLVAINLDPYAAHEADFELPLWEWGLPDHGALQVEDLWHGTRTTWHGKMQHLRLDPGELPFAIWRVGPHGEELG